MAFHLALFIFDQDFSANSPNTIVYNQCANLVLEDAMKPIEAERREFRERVDYKQIHDGSEVPPAPKRGDINVIVAGFPW